MKNFYKILFAFVLLFLLNKSITKAQTYFHGGIYANTTWTLANSPYIITDTVVVFPGDTLTIQPGVVVKFDSTVYMEIRQASLIASGTAAQPITFEANSTNAWRTFWQGIICNQPDTLVFNYLNFSSATNGIVINNPVSSVKFNTSNFFNTGTGVNFYSGNYNNSSFQHCTWQNLTSGLIFDNSYYDNNFIKFSNLKIDSNTFLNCAYGLQCSGSIDLTNLYVTNSFFINNTNGAYAGFISNANGYYSYNKCKFVNNTNNGLGLICAGKIDSCQFTNNYIGLSIIFNYGFYNSNSHKLLVINSSFIQNNTAYSSAFNSSNYLDSATIQNCLFNKNVSGILMGYANHQLIINNIIDSNSTAINGFNFISTNILSNDIKFNGVGINASGSSITKNNISYNSIGLIHNNNSVKQNIISSNGIGIKGGTQLDSIYCNKIYHDTIYDFQYLNSSLNTHIGSNDWGDTSIANIRAKIYDGYTNIALGLVNFLPIDTNQCYLSGCNLVLTPTVTNATCDTCHNGKISVQTSGGGAPYHYTWYTTPLQTTSTISNLKTGKYHFCVTDVRGCGACDTVFVDSVNCNAFHTSAKIIAASCATCNDGAAKITHSLSNAPYLFAWNTIPIQNTDSATALSYGTHIGCVTDHNNCQSCDTVFIDSTRCKNFAVQLTSTAVSCKTCNDGKAYAIVIAGTSPYSFNWNTIPVTTVDSIMNQHFGMYTVIVTDANSCTTTDSIYVDSVNCMGFTIQTFADSVSCNTCNNGKAWVHAQGGVMPYSYHWNSFPINLSDTIKNQHQGVYQVCVKDNQGCQLCQNVLIDSFNCGNMHVNAYGKNTTCGTCTNGAAWAVATGGAMPYTYLWNTTQTTDSIKNISVGNYIVTATDWHGCKSADTIQIDSTLCFGFHATEHHFNPTCATCTDGVAWLTVNGGQQPYHYTWFTSPLQNSTSVNNLGIGTYTVCVNDANTCTLCDTIILNQYCSAQFIINPDTIPHHYFAVNMASGTNPIQYTWYWGDGLSDTGATPSHVYAQAGFYTVCLNIIDANNCTQTYCDSFYLMRMKNSMISLNVIKETKTNTGVNDLTMNNERLMVYPNPANQSIVVSLKSLVNSIEITNVIGQKMKVNITPLSTYDLRLNTNDFPSGIYFLKATDNKGIQYSAKFVKE